MYPQIILVFLLLTAGQARAMSWSAGGMAGMMLQPTSQYYHLVYGGYVGGETDGGGLSLRLGYAERPAFESAGFRDQEYGSFLLLGTRVADFGVHGFTAFAGAGKLEGYIGPSAPETAHLDERSFELEGVALALEYGVRAGPVDIALSHLTMIGNGTKTQQDAFVAWPYNFFFLQLGIRV